MLHLGIGETATLVQSLLHIYTVMHDWHLAVYMYIVQLPVCTHGI